MQHGRQFMIDKVCMLLTEKDMCARYMEGTNSRAAWICTYVDLKHYVSVWQRVNRHTA
jgi:hypothetical protein